MSAFIDGPGGKISVPAGRTIRKAAGTTTLSLFQ
jgi:hypothetical protein